MDSNGSNNTYKIQAGDTMASIADKKGISLDALKAANLDVTNPDLIYPGKTINIPAANASGGATNFSNLQGTNYTNVVIGGGNAVSEQSKSPEEAVATGLAVPKPPKNSFFSKFKFF